MVAAEKEFLRYQGSHRTKSFKRNLYKSCLKDFDRAYNKSKRQYKTKEGDDIEQLSSDDPTEFWRRVKQLGPQHKKDTIPIEILHEDGTSSFDTEEVLGSWQHAFQQIYENSGDFDEEFHERIKKF